MEPIRRTQLTTVPVWTPEDCMRANGIEPHITHDISIPEELDAALAEAIEARRRIPEAQAVLNELLESAQNPIERDARLYQIDLMKWQLTRAADLAQERRDYLSQIKTEDDAILEQLKCAKDVVHWFRMYAWSVDPRPDAPLSLMPFSLFPFQERFVEWLNYITFTKRISGAVEKARDMGATETALRWVLYNWLYGNNFRALILSANEDLFDSKKDPDTLFEKIRLQLRMLPKWMRPTGFSLERDMPYMSFANPDNKSVIIGDAPTGNVGRQRRATFVLRDEFAAWPHGGFPQHTALSKTSNTNCSLSSVQGKFNKFADITHDAHTAKFEMDWRDHPWRDDRWFKALQFGYLGDAMTEQEIAQEVERNYEASQPGRVLKNIQEPYCLITFEEMITGFERLGFNRQEFLNGDRPMIPFRWNWGRVTDYGESARKEDDTHIWAYSLFARPGEKQPLEDSLFFFFSLPIEPIGATELEGYAYYSSLESELGLRSGRRFTRDPSINDMSHEATDPKEVLLKQCGDRWSIPDLDFDKGRRKLVFHFEVIDKEKPNPFRPELMGRCRIYFVALPRLDGQEEYFFAKNDRTGQYFVTPSLSQRGFKRLRAEWNAWHYPPEERGKPVPKMRPKPVFDDIITTVRYAVARWGVSPKPQTEAQRREAKLPGALQNVPRIISEHGEEYAERAILARAVALTEVESRERPAKKNANRYRPMVPRMPGRMRPR
jgi:hypothetical protein